MKKYPHIKHQNFVKRTIGFHPTIPISLIVALGLNIASAENISYDNGTTILNENITATSENQTNNIFNLTNNASLVINGSIASNNGNNYFYNTGSGAITIGDISVQRTISLSGTGTSKVIITDYKEVGNDFAQSPTGKGTLNLNLSSLSFLGSDNRKTFIADNLKGHISIDSLTCGQGNTLIMRFRENNTDTSINLSKVGSQINIEDSGADSTTASKLLLQASNINIGSNIATSGHSMTEIYLTSGDGKGGFLTINDGFGTISNTSNSATTNLGFLGSGTFNTSISNTAGTINIDIANGASGIINGTISTTQGGGSINVNFLDDETKLILQGKTNQITNLSSSSGVEKIATLTLADSTITTIRSKISVDFGRGLGFELGNSSNLTLFGDLENSGVMHLDFIDSAATLTGSIITNNNGKTIFNLGSNTNLSNPNSTTTAIIDGKLTNNGTHIFNLNAKDSKFKNRSVLIFSTGINIVNFNNTSLSGAKLWWQDYNYSYNLPIIGGQNIINFNNNGSILGGINVGGGNTSINIGENKVATISGTINTIGGSTTINFSGANGVLNGNISSATGVDTSGTTIINFKGDGTLNGGISSIDSGTTTINISDNTTALIAQNITVQNSTVNLAFQSSADNVSSLILQGTNNKITSLTMGNGESILALAENGIKGRLSRNNRREITIDNIVKKDMGYLKLVSQVTENSADSFIINNSSGTQMQKNHFGISFEEGTILKNVGAKGKILLAKVKGLDFETTTQTISNFTIATACLSTEQEGDYTNYYILKARGEVVEAEQAVTATALMLNYDLYITNLNSLNKRMGELRENAHSQGIWARVFNGAQSNNFGLGSKNNYTTIQAGYDYAFGFEGANNYLGVALSYALSTSATSSKAVDSMGEIRSIDSIYSNAVEVALYNSYVSDSGWYNDTIAKFSYLMSSFNIANSNSNATTNNSTNNFALTLGDEVGYVFKLGSAKEWSIAPQVEFTMGYFNQSDFKQTLANSSAYLDSIAESVLTLRTRVGSAFAYDFKNFTQKDTFNASLYVGAFYEYDYVSGGNITMSTDQGVVNNELSDIGSDGRVVINVGTNMTIKDNTRVYFDFEKSFLGKITTDYQVNFGVRYNFGESNEYAPMIEKTKFEAPLKIEDGESKEEKSSEDKVSEISQEKEVQ